MTIAHPPLFLSRSEAEAFYDSVLGVDHATDMRVIDELVRIKGDLYFLLTRVCSRDDAKLDWVFDRCNEVMQEPDGVLDLWSRFHFKSSIITFALTILEVIKDPEIRICILSYSRATAIAFQSQIKRELEENPLFHWVWPDIFYKDPERESPKWGEYAGITVKRRGNAKEATIEGWGMVEGQPVGRHFPLRVYDDIVTQDTVSNPEMIHKTTGAWERSIALGEHDSGRERYAGTRYNAFDTYATMMDRGVKSRVRKCVDDEGRAVMMSQTVLDDMRIKMSRFNFAAQMMLDPRADSLRGFEMDWLQHHSGVSQIDARKMNRYLIVDPANEKKKTSDYTAMVVIGLAEDQNYYVLDMVRDRLGLYERVEAVIELHRKWSPRTTGYEKYGKDVDIDVLRKQQADENYRFGVVEIGGRVAKTDRIDRLQPSLKALQWFFPPLGYIPRVMHDGEVRDMVETFVKEEYQPYPAIVHDDMLDVIARILDENMGARFPKPENSKVLAASATAIDTNFSLFE